MDWLRFFSSSACSQLWIFFGLKSLPIFSNIWSKGSDDLNRSSIVNPHGNDLSWSWYRQNSQVLFVDYTSTG